MMPSFDMFDKMKRSHSLVYSNAKMFVIDRITIIFALVIAILMYWFLVDKTMPIVKVISYVSIFTFIFLYILDYFLYPFIFKYFIGENIDGIWEGKFIRKEKHYTNQEVPIKKFEVMDFGKKCLIRVETDSFVSHSIVAKLINKQQNTIELNFIYDVSYIQDDQNQEKNDHYGMTEMIFYKDKSMHPKGQYYTRDNDILRYGKIILDRKIK